MLGRGAERWCTLRDSAQAFDVFLCEEEIVRASLDGNIRTLRASFSSEGSFKAPTDFTWSAAAEDQLNERLSRLMDGNGNGTGP